MFGKKSAVILAFVLYSSIVFSASCSEDVGDDSPKIQGPKDSFFGSSVLVKMAKVRTDMESLIESGVKPFEARSQRISMLNILWCLSRDKAVIENQISLLSAHKGSTKVEDSEEFQRGFKNTEGQLDFISYESGQDFGVSLRFISSDKISIKADYNQRENEISKTDLFGPVTVREISWEGEANLKPEVPTIAAVLNQKDGEVIVLIMIASVQN